MSKNILSISGPEQHIDDKELIKTSIVQELLEIFYYNKSYFQHAEEVSVEPVLTNLSVVGRVEITTEMWRGFINVQKTDTPVVCFRVVTSPARSKGDNVHYVDESINQALALFKDVIITSDDKGKYFIW